MAEDKKNSQKDSSKTQQEKSTQKGVKKAPTESKGQVATKQTTKDKTSPQSRGGEAKAVSNKKEDNKQTAKPAPAEQAENTKANTPVENQTTPQNNSQKEKPGSDTTEQKNKMVKLEGLFAFKMAMTTFYNEKGEKVPVTALKYEPCYISQIKRQEKESYNAVQVAFKAQKNKRCSKPLIGHLKSSGFKEGARFVKEIRQPVPEDVKPGQELSIESLKKGDLVKISSLSKGRGFAGVMKRWNFAGGKASHGSKSHRRTGSIGQHTEPARVMPGRKMPGQYGFKRVSRLKVPVVDVLPEEGMIFVKGPVPGARNTLVALKKMPNTVINH